MARTLLLVVCLLGLLAGSFGQVLQYYKEFTVVPPGGALTVCGPVANIDILAGVANPLDGWSTVCAPTAAPVTVSRFARIIGFGITAKASVPSGQWNFLSASITSANGLSEQLFPKGGFTSACGKVTPIAGSDSQINFEVFEPDICPAGPNTQALAEAGFGKFDNTADPLAAAIPLNLNKYVPFPRNRFTGTNLTPRWVNVPFFPDGTLNAQTKLGSVSFNTGLVQFPFCWSSMKLRVWVSNCPSNTLASDYAETPALVTAEQPVTNPNPNPATDTYYRGSSATWRQLTPLSHTTDRVQVDFITAWKKTYTNFVDADLKALRVDVFVEPITLGSVPIISTNFLDFDTTITPNANRIGTQWGGLGAVAAATAAERDRQFLMDDIFGYNVYVRSMVFTIPGRPSIEAPRTVRIVLSGCCRPGALFKINGAGTPAVPVASGVDLSFDTTIVARLEHPSSASFPRSSPELYVPPIQFLSGSETPMAAPDTVAFGGFVKGAVNGAAEVTNYAFAVSEISPAAPSLQEVSSTFEPTADPTSVVVKGKFLRPTSFQPGLFVAPPPLSGTTARGTLTQTSQIGGQSVVVSSITHDFLVFRRQIEITNSVNEMQYCNFLRDMAGNLITPTKAYQTGNAATVAFTTVGLTGPTPSIEHKYAFPQDKQCGNQIGVRPLRATATVFQRGTDCPLPNSCALQTDLTGTRTPGTPYPALWFLYNDGSSAIAPVYTTRAAAAYVPQALYGLDILAVASVGFPVRTVDGVSTALSRERLGITYCYSRAYVTCTTSPTFTVVATGGNCVSPAGDTVAACPTNGQLGQAVVTLNPGHGNGNFVFLFTAKAADGTISTLGSQTVSFTGAQQILTYNSPSPIAAGSTVSYAITDPAQCTYRGPLVIAPTSAPGGAVSSITVTSVTQPTCTVAGSATITFVYQGFAGSATSATLITTAGGAGADFVGGAAPANVVVNFVAAGPANTWTITTPSVVRGGTVIYSFALPTSTGTTITYRASATFTSVGPALTGTVSISTQFVATVTAGSGVPPYTYAFAVAGNPRTAIAGTPNSVQLSTATDAGATLTYTITDSKGCTFVGTQALPGGAAGGQMAITVTGLTPPTSADAAAVVSFSVTATGITPAGAGNTYRFGLMYCLAGTSTTCNTWSTVSNVALNPIITSLPPLPGTSTVVFRLRARRLFNNLVTSVPDGFSTLQTYTIPTTPTPPFYYPPDIAQSPIIVTVN